VADPGDVIELVFDLGLYAIEAIRDTQEAFRPVAASETREQSGAAIVTVHTADRDLAAAFGNHALALTAQRARR
jgi:hypothetical protein